MSADHEVLALEPLAYQASSIIAVEPHEQFAANLREARALAAVSQEALGSASGLHPPEISRLERAAREPRLQTIVRLTRALEIRPGELLDGIVQRTPAAGEEGEPSAS